MKKLLITLIGLLCFCSLQAQFEEIEYFDADGNMLTDSTGASFFRIITYRNSEKKKKPIGIVYDHYKNGQLKWEGHLRSVQPDVEEGECRWYHPNGKIAGEGIFKKRKILRIREWAENGRELHVPRLLRTQLFETFSMQAGTFLKEDSISADILEGFGTEELNLENFQYAGEIYELAADIWKELDNELKLAENYEKQIPAWAMFGDSDKAIERSDSALVIRRRLGNKRFLAESWTARAITFWYMERMEACRGSYDSALIIYEQLGDHFEVGRLLNNRGFYELNEGYNEEALELFMRANSICKLIEDQPALAISLSNIAYAWKELGYLDQCIENHEKSLIILDSLYNITPLLFAEPDSLNLKTQTLVSLYQIGDAYYSKGNFKIALEAYQICEKRAQEFKNTLFVANCIESKALAYSRNGDYEQAFLLFERSSFLYDSLGLEEKGIKQEILIGGVCAQWSKPEKALEHYVIAKGYFESTEDSSMVAVIFMNMADVCAKSGEVSKAIQLFRKSKELFQGLNDSLGLAIVLDKLGLLYLESGQLEEAKKQIDQSLEILERGEDKTELAISYQGLYWYYNTIGNFELALENTLKARDIFKELGADQRYSNCLNNIGLAYWDQGDLESALFYLEEAAQIKRTINDQHTLARTLLNLSQIYSQKNDLEKAKEYITQSCKIMRERGDTEDLPTGLSVYSDIYFSLEKIDSAMAFSWEAMEILQTAGTSPRQVPVWIDLGERYYLKDKKDSALICFENAQEIAQSLELIPEYKIRANAKLGSYWLHEHHPEKSLAYLREGIQLSESFLQHTTGDIARQNLISEGYQNGLFQNYVTCQFWLDSMENAFIGADQFKSRTLQKLLQERELRGIDLPPDLKGKQDELQGKLNWIERQLREGPETSQRIALERQRRQLFQEEAILRASTRKEIGESYELRDPQPIDLEQVQEELGSAEVLIEYFFAGSNCFIFVVTQDSFKALQLINGRNISEKIEDYQQGFIELSRKGLQKDNKKAQLEAMESYVDISSHLYKWIWEPILTEITLSGKNIIIIPDGPLYYFPFEILQPDSIPDSIPDSVPGNWGKYEYLVKTHPISYYPSVSSFCYQRRHPPSVSAKKEFLGIAVSHFENQTCNDLGTGEWEPIASADSTLDSISRLWNKEKTTLLIDSMATEGRIKQLRLDHYRYLHFFTHAQIQPSEPKLSKILLTPDEKENGCLELHEIYRLELKADLVTLAACRTGIGKLLPGDGMVGFSQALMYAGTPTVILSLWDVPEESTSWLFSHYYHKLKANRGKDKYSPLRNTQLGMIESQKYANPYNWAPFILIGEH